MYKTRIKWGQSLFGLLSSLLLLSLLGSPVPAATPEIEGIREQIRNNGARWLAAETSITKLPEERRLKRLGLLKEPLGGREDVPSLQANPSVAQGTTYLNYNKPPYDYVTPIKDQGDCACCWAFSTTAALESQVLMATHATPASINLSEQVLLSCSGAGNCESGGYLDAASNFIESPGLPPDACFPYTATDNNCSNVKCLYWQSDTFAITGWQYVATNSPTVDDLKSALLTYGPLVTTMQVYSDFYSYAGGVYSYVSGSYQGGHAIEIIGYDDSKRCFIVKNSWGTDWGENGFFRISYDEVNDDMVQFGYNTIAYERYGYTTVQENCGYSISPKSVSVAYHGGYANVHATSQSGCSWTAVSNVKWMKIVSGTNGAGSGTIRYYVNANYSTAGRTGTLTIGGKTFTVTQKPMLLPLW